MYRRSLLTINGLEYPQKESGVTDHAVMVRWMEETCKLQCFQSRH